MRAVVQRVSRASVAIDGEICGQIDAGLVVLLGVAGTDTTLDAEYLADKIVNLRIFDDAAGKMNLSLVDTGGGLLVISQFTLYGNTRRGRRPSFIQAAPPNTANNLYEHFLSTTRKLVDRVESGRFQAMMDVSLVNNGPVTLVLDTEKQ